MRDRSHTAEKKGTVVARTPPRRRPHKEEPEENQSFPRILGSLWPHRLACLPACLPCRFPACLFAYLSARLR
ncbi:hypothetical protein E2C01_098147 [Portunus trituberculatus]|uniref:Uncharacterized protein n=1 Tax=Portunus trituberculatus TaxID=210409 RepID=A0A5B7KBE0_PORTR|nr:hypothetical protein [Portunus trituberculatus]